jgi:glycosyltransferase involved in cell wall biosynthesis
MSASVKRLFEAAPEKKTLRTARPMRVAFVLSGLGAGGAERVVSLISSAWASRGNEVSVISFDGPDERIFHNFDPQVRLVRLSIPAEGGILAASRSAMMRALALRRSLREHRPDLIVSFLTKVNALTLVAAAGSGRPVVVSERNNPTRQEIHPAWNLLLAWLYRRASAVVMQTEASLSCLPKSGRSRAMVIPNPIPAPAARRLRSPTSGVVVAVGRLVRQKGFDLLIEAFSRVAADHPAWTLEIWGEGPERPAIEARIEASGLAHQIKLRGLSAAPASWMTGASVFVLSSRYEGFPNALGEAMAAGLPVAAFDCSFGPGEMVRNEVDGLLVPDEDVGALTAALDRLMTDPALRARLGNAAREASARFAPEKIIAQWDALTAGILP